MIHSRRRGDGADAGFGLVEVVIAMAILGLLAIAVLPVIVTGLGVAAKQSDVATATQLVSSAIDEARGNIASGCGALGVSHTVTDGRGTKISVTGSVVGPAPAPVAAGGSSGTVAATGCTGLTLPATVVYSVTAVDASNTSTVFATATTQIFIPDSNG